MEKELVIIGGGVAGLCAAIQLAHVGVLALVIEAGGYPSHKVCGEFLSPETLPILKKWGIEPRCIKKACFFTTKKNLSLNFQTPAGGLSHLILDPALLEYAKSLGVEILTHVKVESLDPKQNHDQSHVLKLSNGHKLRAKSLIFAVGKLPCLTSAPPIKYIGIKAHFTGIDLEQTLHMFGFKDAYLGISVLEDDKSNLACLASVQKVQQAGSVESFMEILKEQNAFFKELLCQATPLFDWMTAAIPSFGFKSHPKWLDVYFIGDAALSVPPVCGGGLALAMTSGVLVADYVIKRDHIGFSKHLKRLYANPLNMAKTLHYCLMRPSYSHMIFKGCSLYPSLAQRLFTATRPCRSILSTDPV